MKRMHAFVAGRVQGVSFRYYTRHRAQQLNVTGWVRNLPDGRVEVMAEGPEAILRQMEQFLQRGSPAAQVRQVTCDWSEATGEFRQFLLYW